MRTLLRNWKRNKGLRYGLTIAGIVLLFYYHFGEAKSSLKPEALHLVAKQQKEMVTLVVLVMTGPKNVDRRNVIRSTWLSGASGVVRHFFVIGSKNLPRDLQNQLDKEQERHQDLLVFPDFEDSYQRLTEKLALMLEWTHQNIDFKYVLKADDDTYARLDVITKELENDREKRDATNLYWGFFYGKGRVKKSGPWKETNWKLCDYYLPYARGGGYVLSRNLVAFVAANWRQFQVYNSEDVSLGTWLAPLKLDRLHDVRFDTEYKSRGCKNAFIVCHKQSLSEMSEKHENLQNHGKLCLKESNHFHGYEYDWGVPPSQCCKRSNAIP